MPSPKQSLFDRWFERHRPDVIISVDSLGLRLMEGRGLQIPGEIGYATLDRDELPASRSDISGIDQNSHLVGAAAVDMLVAAIQRGQHGIPTQPLRTEIEGSWKSGRSTPRRHSLT